MAWDDDIGDEPHGALRDAAPDMRTPIDPDAPIGGHHPPPTTNPIHETPEQDWSVAATLVVPLLRPAAMHGTNLGQIDREQLATEGLRSHALPLIDDGPAGLTVAYAIPAGGFDVLINADHLLGWGIDPETLRATALRNLGAWSETQPWTDEVDGVRRLLSSDSGDGGDASRILLPEVRAQLAAQLGAEARVIVGLPERHLLVAASLRPDDPEFVGLFGDFVATRSDGSDEPIDRRLFELVDGELRVFTL